MLMLDYFEVKYILNDVLFLWDVFGKLGMLKIEVLLLLVEGKGLIEGL